MHSCRMRTVRSSTVSRSIRGGPAQAPWMQTPPADRMTDTCKNITLPQTSFTGSNKDNNPYQHCVTPFFMYDTKDIITVRNIVVARLFSQVSVILFTGGVSAQGCVWQTPPAQCMLGCTPQQTLQQTVCILLECILVNYVIHKSLR